MIANQTVRRNSPPENGFRGRVRVLCGSRACLASQVFATRRLSSARRQAAGWFWRSTIWTARRATCLTHIPLVVFHSRAPSGERGASLRCRAARLETPATALAPNSENPLRMVLGILPLNAPDTSRATSTPDGSGGRLVERSMCGPSSARRGLEPDGGALQAWIFQRFTSAGIRK